MPLINLHSLWSKRGLANYLLWPVSQVWGLAQRLHRLRYRLSPPPPLPKDLRVVSVGNILVGGSGKTPFTIYLAKLLQSRGERVAVALRGYRGDWEKRGGLVSDANGLRPDAAQGGDEALLLAENLPGVSIAVGASRRDSIARLRQLDPDLRWVILDDAFQHLKVRHTASFLLFNASRKVGNGLLLPAGPMREPLSVASIADAAVVVGEGDSSFLTPTGLPVISGRYEPDELRTLDGAPVSLETVRNSRVALVSGIGNPASFEQTVRGLGVSFFTHFAFADHQDFSTAFDQLRISKADYLLTTAKDAARLRNNGPADLPFVVLPIRFVTNDEAAVLRVLGT